MMARKHIYSGSPFEELAGYARAVQQGPWIFVSGTVGMNFETGIMPEDAAQQAEQAIVTIQRALKEAGATLGDVVRVRVYIPDREDVNAVSQVIKAHFGPHRPANTTVCAPLAVPGCKVEIEVTALKSTAE
jgi:enamine deaminase RidA (YjgF/YER057c/UK114 family)